ncbi:MAG: hypothetical protein AAGJ83_08365, partial [Planctomycetota bacterium]
SFETYNGSIDLLFPADLSAKLRYKTEQGTVQTDFDVDVADGSLQVASPPSGDFKFKFDEFVTGIINGGRCNLTLETTNGDIRLRRQD